MAVEYSTKEESWRAKIRQAQQGNREIRNELVAEHMGLVYLVRKRFANRGHDMEELFQIGTIGLMKAIDHFDTDRELAFSTYAVPMISGEIKRFLRDDGMVHISRKIKDNARKILMIKEEFNKSSEREPTMEELVKLTGLSLEDVVLALESTYEVESISRNVRTEKGNDNVDLTLEDQIADKKNEEERLINRISVEQLLEGFSDKERNLIILRYMKNKTQSETAKLLGMNQVAVSRLEKKILSQMRKKLES